MSLEGLFTDRKARKYIKESIYNANDAQGTCRVCGRHGASLMVFGDCLCEECCNKAIEISEDYDHVFTSSDNEYVIESIIAEGFVTGDFTKLENDANAKGLTIAKFLKSEYGLTIPNDLGKQFDQGKIYVPLSDISGGKTKINRFIDDYNVQFPKPKTIEDLVPDADGYLAKIKGGASNGAVSISAPTSKTASTVNTSSNTTKAAKPVKAKGPGYSAEGSDDKFDIKVANDIFLECTRVSQQNGADVYEVVLKDSKNSPISFSVAPGTLKEKSDFIMKEIRENPCSVFSSFDDDFESAKGYILNEYPFYSFMFDDDSFDGKALTLVLALNGTPYTSTRIELTKRDIISKAALDGKLVRALNERLAKFYPCLFDGSMDINTSIGRALSSLDYVDNKNVVQIHTELGNEEFVWTIDGKNLNDKELSINSMLDAVYSKLDKVIPDWNSNAIREKKTVKGYTDCFCVEVTIDPKADINLNFSLEELYDKHDFIFHMSVIDKQSGIEQPKEFVPVVYNKSGVKIENFAKANGSKIYTKYFNKSDMVDTISASAQEKLSNRSKREVFLSYLADVFKRSLGNDTLKNLDLDIEEFDVNSDHKVTNVVFRVSDPYNEVAGTSDKLKDIIKVDKEPWIKLVKVDDSPRSMKENGPSVIYKVTKINDFSDCVNLRVLESVMLEAFGFISERKTISINEEAYWKVVDGEYTIVM